MSVWSRRDALASGRENSLGPPPVKDASCRLEQLRSDRRRNARPGVGNPDFARAVRLAGADADAPPALHRLRAVDEQVVKDELQQLGIGVKDEVFPVNIDADAGERWIVPQE